MSVLPTLGVSVPGRAARQLQEGHPVNGQPEQLDLIPCPASASGIRLAEVDEPVDETDVMPVPQLDLLCLGAAIEIAASTGLDFRRLTDTDVDGAELAARMDTVAALLRRQMREREGSA